MRDAQLARNTPCQQSWRGHGSERIPSTIERYRSRIVLSHDFESVQGKDSLATENSGAKDKLKSMNLSLAVFPEVVFHCYHVSNDHACRKAGTFWNQAYLKWWKFRLERVLDFDYHAGCHDPTPYIKHEYVIWKQYPQLSVFGKKYVASLFIIPKFRNLAFEHVTSVLTMLGRFQSLYGHPKLPRMRDILCPSLPWICNRCCRDRATCDSGSYLARGETRWTIHQPLVGKTLYGNTSIQTTCSLMAQHAVCSFDFHPNRQTMENTNISVKPPIIGKNGNAFIACTSALPTLDIYARAERAGGMPGEVPLDVCRDGGWLPPLRFSRGRASENASRWELTSWLGLNIKNNMPFGVCIMWVPLLMDGLLWKIKNGWFKGPHIIRNIHLGKWIWDKTSTQGGHKTRLEPIFNEIQRTVIAAATTNINIVETIHNITIFSGSYKPSPNGSCLWNWISHITNNRNSGDIELMNDAWHINGVIWSNKYIYI